MHYDCTEAATSLPNVGLRVSMTGMGLIGTWTVAWTPYAIVALIGISGYGHLLTVNNNFYIIHFDIILNV